QKYLSVVKAVDCVVGNSSSGLIEVPLLKTPTVNIGKRQQGRLLASSVVNSDCHAKSIVDAITTCLSEDFQQTLENIQTPYGQGDVSVKIKNILKQIELEHILQKEF